MANKVRANMEMWLRWYEEGRETKDEIKKQFAEVSDLIYRMWQQDFISDKVKDECFAVYSEVFDRFLRLYMKREA